MTGGTLHSVGEVATAGTVYLVGAGPGDPGLLTRRAHDLLATADVVIYDQLGTAEVIGFASPAAQLIAAGKAAGRHSMKQPEINALIIEHALQGRAVVRLKGGDPFVFGRGGEEGLACERARIPFVVVPAVTSAVAVPAYAGIPVTHREVARSVTFVTASTATNEDVNFSWLAQCPGTLVVLMGLRKIADIAEALVARGAPAERAAAVVSQGTTARQRTVVGTLANIGARVAEQQLTPPGILVVGDAVALREQLTWFERRPLFGTSVVVTRARNQASRLVQLLRGFGADVVECSTIRIEPLPHELLDSALGAMHQYDYVLFTSINAVDQVAAALARTGLDARAFAGTQIGAVGESTSARLQQLGLRADFAAPAGVRTAMGLVGALEPERLDGRSVLLIGAEQRSTQPREALVARGASVREIAVYRTVAATPDPDAVQRALASDIAVFASASSVQRFVALTANDSGLLPPAIVIGPTTRAAAEAAGLRVCATASEPSVDSLVSAVLAFAAEHSRNVSIV